VRVRVATFECSGARYAGFVYALDDLTEIRRLEREVRMQDRLAAVGRLAAAIAHEIRNPLTSIAGSVSMLSGIPELNQEHRQLLDIVTRESQRLTASLPISWPTPVANNTALKKPIWFRCSRIRSL